MESDLICYFKDNTFRKKSMITILAQKLFKRIKSGKLKLEEVKKKLHNAFKPNLNEIWRGKYKSKEQKSAL